WIARHLRRSPPLGPPTESALAMAPTVSRVRFDPVAQRGTASFELAHHAPGWQARMTEIGERFVSAGVIGIVFAHGTFAGDDPLAASRLVERAVPRLGPYLARTLRRKTRAYVERTLGDVGNFGAPYARLFEEAIRRRDPG